MLLLFAPFLLLSKECFSDYFTEEALRFDYLLSGTNTKVKVIEIQQKREPFWAGSASLDVDDLNLGNYRFVVRDLQEKKVIYTQGFSPIFQEWQTTAEAKKMERAFYQVLRFPFPKAKVILEIEYRSREGGFLPLYTSTIDPSDYFIRNEPPCNNDFVMLRKSGAPSEKVDIAILAEGYKKEEMEKFIRDAGRMTDSLLKVEPFASLQSAFNVYAVKSPSEQSGTDIPGRGIYVNTLYNSTFYTFNISRYLTTTDLKSVYDQAAGVPYDYLIVLVNSAEYGGGGFCNFLSVCTADHSVSSKVFIHEFGHEFAGLGDEYYTSEVAYEDFYNLKAEPWEPNLTTLINFKVKWGSMILPATPIPTPRTNEYTSATGVFEGGGYMAKGIFSPMQDCRMKSNKPDYFCPVCQEAIRKAIRSHTH
jgi:hypothetical protein